MRILRLYLRFIKTFLKSKIEYRIGFTVEILANILMIVIYYLGIWIMFQNFDNIVGWTYTEVMFLFNLNWVCYSISGFFLWKPMLSMGEYIKSGDFDAFLIRPMRPLIYLIFRQFQYTFIARLILAIAFFVFSSISLNILWDIGLICYCLVSAIAGIVIHASILIIVGAISFWTIENEEIGNLITSSDSGLRTFTDYPITIYGISVRAILIFIIPYAFVNFFPAEFILRKTVAVELAFLPPIIAIAVATVAFILWNLGLKRYESTGN